MLDELPQALTLVLVYDVYPGILWSLDHGSSQQQLLGQRLLHMLALSIQGYDLSVLCEVHEAVSAHVVDEQLVVKVYLVSLQLVATMRVNLPDDL